MSMLHKAIQNRWCRLALAVAATLLYAIGVNWFIVPMGLYTGGLLGFCQVARTLIVEALGLSPNVDFSGILYLAANVPILLLAWQALGRGFLVRTAVCTVTSSLFLSLVPPPAAPLVEETLTNCVLGGILVGFSLGIVLTCGCSTGGLDILGLWLASSLPSSVSATVMRFCIFSTIYTFGVRSRSGSNGLCSASARWCELKINVYPAIPVRSW